LYQINLGFSRNFVFFTKTADFGCESVFGAENADWGGQREKSLTGTAFFVDKIETEEKMLAGQTNISLI